MLLIVWRRECIDISNSMSSFAYIFVSIAKRIIEKILTYFYSAAMIFCTFQGRGHSDYQFFSPKSRSSS